MCIFVRARDGARGTEIVLEILIGIVMQTLDQINFTKRCMSESYALSLCIDMHRSTLVWQAMNRLKQIKTLISRADQ